MVRQTHSSLLVIALSTTVHQCLFKNGKTISLALIGSRLPALSIHRVSSEVVPQPLVRWAWWEREHPGGGMTNLLVVLSMYNSEEQACGRVMPRP